MPARVVGDLQLRASGAGIQGAFEGTSSKVALAHRDLAQDWKQVRTRRSLILHFLTRAYLAQMLCALLPRRFS